MIKRIVIGSLSAYLAVVPALLQAATITVAPGGTTTMGSTAKNVPIENIAAPNAKGVSLNKFTDFNVGTEGLVINNAKGAMTSSTGERITANANLGAGVNAAKLVINQVVGSNRSLLEGTTEIVGAVKADYILVNSNGISCNGCGFINTPRATLSTGTPVFDAAGNLKTLSVAQGDVTIGGAGLDARNVDYFDIVSRTATLNATLYGNEVQISAGSQDYDYANHVATAKEAGQPTPQLLIDSTALGGIQADSITLVGSEKGVGVNLKGVFNASQDLIITNDGEIAVNGTFKGNNLKISGDTLDIVGSLTATDAVTLAAKDVIGVGATVEGRDVTVSGSYVWVGGSLIAADKVTVTSEGYLALSGTAKGNNLNVSGGYLDIRGTLIADNDMNLTSDGSISLSGAELEARNIDVSASNNISLSGSSFVVYGYNYGNINLIAGNNISINDSSITSYGYNYSNVNLIAGNSISINDSSIASSYNYSNVGYTNSIVNLIAGDDVLLRDSSIVSEGNINLIAGYKSDTFMCCGVYGPWYQPITGGNISLSNSSIASNSGGSLGSILLFAGYSLSINDSFIVNNGNGEITLTAGGNLDGSWVGINSAWNIGSSVGANISISNSSIANNTRSITLAAGDSISISNGSSVVSEGNINLTAGSNNDSWICCDAYGYWYNPITGGSILISDSYITSNVHQDGIGYVYGIGYAYGYNGINLSAGDNISIINSSITNNIYEYNDSYIGYSGINLNSDKDIVVINSSVTNNLYLYKDGWIDGYGYKGINLNSGNNILFSNSYISNNVSTYGSSRGYVYSDITVNSSNSISVINSYITNDGLIYLTADYNSAYSYFYFYSTYNQYWYEYEIPANIFVDNSYLASSYVIASINDR